MTKRSYVDDFQMDMMDQAFGKELRPGRKLIAIFDTKGNLAMSVRTRKIQITDLVRNRKEGKHGKIHELFKRVHSKGVTLETLVHTEGDGIDTEILFTPAIVCWVKIYHSETSVVKLLPPDVPELLECYTSQGFELLPKTGQEPFNLEMRRMRVLKLDL